MRWIFQSDQRRWFWYNGYLYILNTRYPDYGPNIFILKPGSGGKYVR